MLKKQKILIFVLVLFFAALITAYFVEFFCFPQI